MQSQQRLAPPGSHRASSKLSSVSPSFASPPSSTNVSSKTRKTRPQSTPRSHPSHSRSRSGSPGSESSSDTPIASAASASTPSSSITGNSPTLPSAETIGKGRRVSRPGSAQAQAKRAMQASMPPPGPPPPIVTPITQRGDYLIGEKYLHDIQMTLIILFADVEGEETGSSSDTDND